MRMQNSGVMIGKGRPTGSKGGYTMSPAALAVRRAAAPLGAMAGRKALAQRTQHTKAELAFESILYIQGHKFETQKRIGRKVVDFYLPATNSVIEVDGEYWLKHKNVPERDAYLLAHGVRRVVHVTDTQLRRQGWL